VKYTVLALTTSIVALHATSALCAPAVAPLNAGAAKVDITPTKAQLPKGYDGVNDPIYVRATVLEHDGRKAALVSVDIGGMPDSVWTAVVQGAQSLGIPSANLMLTATHSHSVPRGVPQLDEKIVEALRQAAAKMQPATIAYGQGDSYININRNIIDPKTRRWWEGPNYEGPSDKTVAVVNITSASGQPIAVYYNYAVHAVVNGQLDMVSGDIPGAASRYIEDALGSGAVAIWSEGASGDQNPIFFQQTYDLRNIRIADYAKRGEDISNAMPPGGQGLDRKNPQVARLMAQQRQMVDSMGQMLGEEVLRVGRDVLDRPEVNPRIFGASKTVTCPGRVRTDKGRAGYPGTYTDGPDVPIRLSLLKIGGIEIGGVNAEVFNPIAERFKARSGSSRTMMATLTNGIAPSGYIPHDEAFSQNTFEVVSSRLKPGCAETAIIEGLLDLEQASESN
jgi:neutral ceramidase